MKIGRSIDKYQLAVAEWPSLLRPDVLICQDGVSIYWFNKKLAQQVQMHSQHQIRLVFLYDMSLHLFLCLVVFFFI